MIFIAESGSTKTDAVFLTDDGQEVMRITFMGFNPYFHSAEVIQQELGKIAEVGQYGPDVKQVYFYGAGCSSSHLNNIVKEGLKPSFPSAEITVDHDLKASAFATYSGEPAISCILGTGSNSVFFDGNEIYEEVPSLAFILGDEGSASYIGKKLITSYFYKSMPEEAASNFEKEYKITKDEVIKRVYNEPHANVYLSGFAPFAGEYIDHPFFWELVFSGFRQFLEIHVLCYARAREVPIHFVGSVAFHYREILQDALDHMDLRMGQIVQKPLDGLINYHRKYLLTSSSQPL